MIDLDAQEPLSNISDSSFVILGQGSLPSHLNEDSDGPKESPKADSSPNSKSTFSVFESLNSSTNERLESVKDCKMVGSGSSDEELKKKLDDVVKENHSLKETLMQNNLAIKSQLDTFFMWQQEVLKTHETHKQKFLETKELILKLLAENKNLKKQTEESLQRVSSTGVEDVNVEINKKSEELEELKEKIKEFEKICSHLTAKNENLDVENQKLREELKAEKKEILKLNKELEDFERENTQLKHSIEKNSLEGSSLRSLPNAEARAQINNLLKQLEEEKGKVAKLKEELKRMKLSDTEATQSTAEEFNECLDKINDIHASLDLQNQRLSSLSWVALSEENLKEFKAGGDQRLMGEITALKNHTNQEMYMVKEKQKDLEELRNQFNKLLLDHKGLQLQLNSIQINESSIEKYKEEISRLSSELLSKNRELVSKEEECQKLKEAVANLQEKCDVITLQAEIYKTDFNEEREARRKCSEVKAELGAKLIHLENQIQAMKGSNESENNPENPSEEGNTWTCPMCFLSLSAPVLEHLHRCQGLDN